MEKVKIRSLGVFDEQKLKKIADDRKEWLESGYNMIINPKEYKINKIVNECYNSRNVVGVKKILKENSMYKTIVLTSQNNTTLPLFRAGQKIALTINIDGIFYTRSYSIISSPSLALMGEYHITVKKSDDLVDSYLYNSLKIAEKFMVSLPFGEFYYESLRDEKNIIGIVNDKGIMPVYSMVQAIIDGTLDCNLTLFYSARVEDELLYKDELKEYDNKSSKIRVFFVLSEEEKEGYMTGFVSTDKIKPYYRGGETSFFIAGNEGLLKYLNKELEQFKLPRKFIRYDEYLPECTIKRVVKYNLGIYINGEKFDIPCYNNKTLLKAIEEGGIYIPSKCQNGSCGLCRSELVKGEVRIVNDKRSAADKEYNYIHPCSTYPMSDIEIVVR